MFSAKACGASEWAGSGLHVDRGAGRARRPHSGTNVRVERRKPRGMLPALGSVGTATGGHSSARRSAASGLGEALLRLSPVAARVAAARALGQRQARAAFDTRRQSALPAHAALCACNDRFAAWLAGLAQSGARAGDAKHQSTLGGRHHLRATAGGVCLCRRCSRCAFAPRDRLGAGTASGSESGRGSFAHGAARSATRTRSDSSLRPRHPVRLRRLSSLC